MSVPSLWPLVILVSSFYKSQRNRLREWKWLSYSCRELVTKTGLELRPADSYLRQMILSLCLVSTMYGIPQVWFLSIVFLWMGHNFLFICIPCNFFLLKTGQFEYYSLMTLEIRFSSFLRVCCCCLLRDTIAYLFSDFSKLFFLQRLHSLPCVIMQVSIPLFH